MPARLEEEPCFVKRGKRFIRATAEEVSKQKGEGRPIGRYVSEKRGANCQKKKGKASGFRGDPANFQKKRGGGRIANPLATFKSLPRKGGGDFEGKGNSSDRRTGNDLAKKRAAPESESVSCRRGKGRKVSTHGKKGRSCVAPVR